MTVRMTNPATILPQAAKAVPHLFGAIEQVASRPPCGRSSAFATINFFNRINVTIQEPAGTTWG